MKNNQKRIEFLERKIRDIKSLLHKLDEYLRSRKEKGE